MSKKLLSLAVAAVAGMSIANAADELVYTVDWTTTQWNSYVMGYIPVNTEDGLLFEWPHFSYVKVDSTNEGQDYEIVKINGEDHYIVPTEDGGPLDNTWGIQAHLLGQNVATEVGDTYKIVVTAKTDKEDGATLGLPFSWGWSGQTVEGSVHVSTEWEDLECVYEEIGGTSCWCVGQMYSGDNDARIWVKKVSVYHVVAGGSHPDVTEWINLLVNGDAEGEYGDVPCAYGKEYKGRAADGSEIAEPEPCTIEEIDGNKVFVVHAKRVDPDEFPDVFKDEDGNVKGDPQWQNQFWIQSPQAWKTGDMFRVSFKYKASHPAAADTQAHGQTPGGYLHWNMIGGINFTTDWQEFSKDVTVEAAANNMWSIAFNLKEYEADNDYYFDDLKWEIMKLQEGWFVAGDFNDWNYAEAVELEWDDDEEAFMATIGGEVAASQIILSDVRGNDKAFKNNSYVVVGDVADGITADFSKSAGKKITLPKPGEWEIIIDPEKVQIIFTWLGEGGGIAGVSVDNAPAVYYNLQGVQVAHPVNGQIYIVKQGNKVSKTIVR